MKLISLAVAVALAGPAAAQMPGHSSAHPANPRAPLPPLRYESAFAGYRAYAEVEMLSWQRANSENGSLRGHIDHIAPVTMPVPDSRPAPSAALPPEPRTAPVGTAGRPQ
jgi:hypothetical protein